MQLVFQMYANRLITTRSGKKNLSEKFIDEFYDACDCHKINLEV